MKKSARVIVTYNCNRSCPGCCNEQKHNAKDIFNEDYLIDFDEINITGGEPMLIADKVVELLNRLRNKGYKGKFYLYTAYWIFSDTADALMDLVDGITYTLHAEADIDDFILLKKIDDKYLWNKRRNFKTRLTIDKRLYEKYDLSNIDLTSWDMVRKMGWSDDCQVPEHEELIYYEL